MSELPSHIDKDDASTAGESRDADAEVGMDRKAKKKAPLAREPSDLDPTRYGDWEKKGRCIDF